MTYTTGRNNMWVSAFRSSLLVSVSWIADEQTFCLSWAEFYLMVVGARRGATSTPMHIQTRGRGLIPSRKSFSHLHFARREFGTQQLYSPINTRGKVARAWNWLLIFNDTGSEKSCVALDLTSVGERLADFLWSIYPSSHECTRKVLSRSVVACGVDHMKMKRMTVKGKRNQNK
jgi:hypothetical protein